MKSKDALKRWKAIAAFVAKGHSRRAACREFKVSPATVSNGCTRYAKQGASTQSRIKSKTLKIIACLQNTELTRDEIAAKHGFSVPAVFMVVKRCRKAGIKIPQRRRRASMEK